MVKNNTDMTTINQLRLIPSLFILNSKLYQKINTIRTINSLNKGLTQTPQAFTKVLLSTNLFEFHIHLTLLLQQFKIPLITKTTIHMGSRIMGEILLLLNINSGLLISIRIRLNITTLTQSSNNSLFLIKDFPIWDNQFTLNLKI